LNRPDANATDRASVINTLLGRPYRSGGNGPDAFDCYGLTRWLQERLYGRDMPAFSLPADAGRFAIAAAIVAHPERHNWVEAERPVDGALAIMSRQECGFHMGTFVDVDGGVVVHALERPGVCADAPFLLSTPAGGRWRIRWNVPA
jgi:hypothetical protein